jgi:prepilin-type N-terminal cleavage/methylation domain-containing protein
VPARDRQSGVTLIELLIVVVLIGIAASLSVVGYFSLIRRERLNALALNVAGWIEEVRNQSANRVSRNETEGGCTIIFENAITGGAGQKIAVVQGGDSACPGLTTPTLEVPASQGSSYLMQSSVAASGQQLITFTPRGMILAQPLLPSGSSYEYRFTLADGKGPKRCIRISDITGTVDIGYSIGSSLSTPCDKYGGL